MYNILCSYGIENYSYDVFIRNSERDLVNESKKTETNIENQ